MSRECCVNLHNQAIDFPCLTEYTTRICSGV